MRTCPPQAAGVKWPARENWDDQQIEQTRAAKVGKKGLRVTYDILC
jgi:hypothetical protein